MKLSPPSPGSHVSVDNRSPAGPPGSPPADRVAAPFEAAPATIDLAGLPDELIERVFLRLPRARDQAALVVAHPRLDVLRRLPDSAYARGREAHHRRRLDDALEVAGGGLCCADAAAVLTALRKETLPFVGSVTLRLRGRDVDSPDAVATVIGLLAAGAPHLSHLAVLAVPLPERLPAALATFEHLTRLTLAGSARAGARHMVAAPRGLGALTGLRALTLANMRAGEGRLEELTGLSRLESLRLEQLSPADEAAAIATRCAHLTALSLAMLEELGALPPHQGWTRLRTLRLRDCGRLGQLGLAGPYLAGLRELDLAGCQSLRVPWQAVRGARALTSLDVRWTLGDDRHEQIDLKLLPDLDRLDGDLEAIALDPVVSLSPHLDEPVFPPPRQRQGAHPTPASSRP